MAIRKKEKNYRTIAVAVALYGFTAFMMCAGPVQAQNCTNPSGVRGDLLFNSTYDVFQACTTRGWMTLHESASDPCTTSSTPGTACLDGQTVYAGSWNGNRYYTTTADQSTGAYWGTRAVDLGANAQSMTNGLTNTNTALASIEGNPQAGACNTSPYNPPACVPNAHVLCKELRTTLGGNWYLPARDEIVNVLYANKVAIGGFSNAWYWSSTEYGPYDGYLVLLTDGTSTQYTSKRLTYQVRCVRRD